MWNVSHLRGKNMKQWWNHFIKAKEGQQYLNTKCIKQVPVTPGCWDGYVSEEMKPIQKNNKAKISSLDCILYFFCWKHKNHASRLGHNTDHKTNPMCPDKRKETKHQFWSFYLRKQFIKKMKNDEERTRYIITVSQCQELQIPGNKSS